MGLGTQEKPRVLPEPESLLSPDQQLALLKRFAPQLRFDAIERWRPGLADAYLLGSTFLDENDAVEPGTPPATPGIAHHFKERESRLNPMTDGPGLDTQLRSNEMLTAYGKGQDLAGAGACYGRVLAEDPATLFLQYWLFYADNPCVLPSGRHDGDWELVQVRLQSTPGGYESTHATVAGHGKPVTLPFRSTEGGPEVFVAIDSHASYFTPGAHPMLPLSDVCDPGLPAAVPSVELLPLEEASAWTFWSGRWGMDRGVGTRIALWFHLRRTPAFIKRLKVGAGESPPSPGLQGQSWGHPKFFQARGTGRRGLIVQVQRLAHLIGRLTWPRLLPAVRVECVAPNCFTIHAKPAGNFARRVSMVSVAFEEVGDSGERTALAMYSARTGHPAGPFEIPHQGEVRWRAAGYNFLRQRGEPAPAQSPTQPPWPLGLSGTSKDDQGARRVFAGALTNHLRRRGATSTDDLVGSLGWFWLRLNRAEVEEVIEAARRESYVAPVGQSKDAAGEPIAKDEWTLTDRGRQLERTRAFSFRDSIVAIRGIGKPVVSATEKWSKRVAAALVTVLPALAFSLEASTSIAVIASGVILVLALSSSLRGETELRRAAEHWPRLRICRPRIHAWQTTAWRPWERLPIAAAAVAYLIAAAVALRITDTWKFNVLIALAVAIMLGVVAWRRLGKAWRRWYALNKAFRRERDRVRNLRRREPDDACLWGHACLASQEGPSVKCPRFGPDATEEADRIPSAI
jgi:hypothetical protein